MTNTENKHNIPGDETPKQEKEQVQTVKHHVLEPVETPAPKAEPKTPNNREHKIHKPKPRKKYPVKKQALQKKAVPNERPHKKMPAKMNKYTKEHRHHKKPDLAHKLVSTITALIGTSIRNFILWGFLSTAIFSVGSYYVFTHAIAGRDFPLWYMVFLGIFVFGVYALFGAVYGIFMAFLYTIKTFSSDMGNLVRESINRIKNSLESRIDNINAAVTHSEAAEIVRQVFANLAQNIKQYAAKTVAGIIAAGILTGVVFLARNTLVAGMRKVKNKADFFTILSAKAALLLAVILNLNFFARLALWFGYLIGLIALLTQALIIFLVK